MAGLALLRVSMLPRREDVTIRPVSDPGAVISIWLTSRRDGPVGQELAEVIKALTASR